MNVLALVPTNCLMEKGIKFQVATGKKMQNPNFSFVLPNRSVAEKYIPCLDVILSAVNRTRAALWQRRGSCSAVGRCTA